MKYWPHWPILKDMTTGQKWAVDRWPFNQGENPAVQQVEDWIPDNPRSEKPI